MSLEPQRIADMENPPWDRRSGETAAEYAWFQQYLELGDKRSPTKTARRCGVSVSLVRDAAARNQWAARAADYDHVVRTTAREWIRDEEDALATQYAVGHAMLHMGGKALELKNPALMDMKTIQALLKEGAELVRRGAGVADIRVSHEARESVEQQFRRLLGEDEIIEGEDEHE